MTCSHDWRRIDAPTPPSAATEPAWCRVCGSLRIAGGSPPFVDGDGMRQLAPLASRLPRYTVADAMLGFIGAHAERMVRSLKPACRCCICRGLEGAMLVPAEMLHGPANIVGERLQDFAREYDDAG